MKRRQVKQVMQLIEESYLFIYNLLQITLPKWAHIRKRQEIMDTIKNVTLINIILEIVVFFDKGTKTKETKGKSSKIYLKYTT